jgi:cysteine desulfurase
MMPWLDTAHGNPSSAHGFGRAASVAVEQAREQVSALLGAVPDEIVFTSSGSEANNAVIAAVAEAHRYAGHLVTSSLEHPSVRAAARRAQTAGMAVTELTPDQSGLITADAVGQALREDTRLVCAMVANNELGTIQPVAAVVRACRAAAGESRCIPVLADAVQAVGKIPVNVQELGVDYLVLGGHKFHGPHGVAALWLRPGTTFAPLLVGGQQEDGRRASTENVPAIVGLGVAADLARREIDQRNRFLRGLRDRFEDRLAAVRGATVHCARSPRLPHTSHIALAGKIGYDVMMALDARGMAVSLGAACHAGKPEPSAVLIAMGLPTEEAIASLRISFGMTNTASEVDQLVDALVSITRKT